MNKIITLLLLFFITSSNAQIGGGWDWAFNTGTLGGTTMKHMKYTADGSEILFGGIGLAAAKFGATTLTAPKQLSYPGSIKFFGKINASTGVPTIIRSFSNLPINFDCITTDAAGNFYIGGAISDVNPVDLGNGVSVSGLNKSVIAKFDAAGNTLWANTYAMGTLGSSQTNILKLAVSDAGNVFFWGSNLTSLNFPLYKLDASGNTLWFKDAINTYGNVSNTNSEFYLSDKFIDKDENVYLMVRSNNGYTFDGVAYPNAVTSSGVSTIIILNGSGTITKSQSFAGGAQNFQVDRDKANMYFTWNQGSVNPAPFNNLPLHPLASTYAFYLYYFSGIVGLDKNFNFLKAKDYSTVANNPFQLGNQQVLALPNGKLIFAFGFSKNGLPYSAGADYLYPTDVTKNAVGIVETDTNWNIAKFISGGKAPSVGLNFLAAYNDTYLLGALFYAEDVANPTANPPLPTTSFGTENLTGFNAAADFTTAYGFYSTTSSFRKDVAFVQAKSANFPTIASTTWLGNTTNWNDAANWSNGIPTNATKAVFNQPTTNYPTVSTTPTSGSIEINSGVSLALPSTLALSGGIINNGTIIVNNGSSFQGFGAKEWKGTGTVNFTGTQAAFFYANAFENALILDTNLSTFYDLNVPSVSFNSGKLNLGNKKLSVTNPSPTAISGVSATSYFYGGTLVRNINPTGVYEFPLGDFSKKQSATISANNLVGVGKLSAAYTAGAPTGTVPNTSYKGVSITSALNGGWFTISPNQQPTSGSYDVTLQIQSSTNASATAGNNVLIKRDSSTSAWGVSGTFVLGDITNGIITAKSVGLTSFSDFAIGKAASDVSLGTSEFSKNQFMIFPNPVSNEINLAFGSDLDKATLKIISITGQTVYQKSKLSGNNMSLNVSELTKGVYMIQVSDGNKISNSKFIKK